MEMTIPQAAPTAPTAPAAPSSGKTSGQAKTGGSDKFQKTLSNQMKSDKGATEKSDAAASTTVKAENSEDTSATTAAATTDATVDQTTTSTVPATGTVTTDPSVVSDPVAELMDIIDQLLADLQDIKSDSTDTDQDQDSKELNAMLDQLNALLALLGIPVPVPQQNQSSSSVPTDAVEQDGQQLAAITSKVQDSLLQLQTAMQEGTMKQVALQEPITVIGQQLSAIQQFVQKQKDSLVRSEKQSGSADQVTVATVTTTTPAVSVHLQRLTQQAVHPVALAASANQQAAEEETEASPQSSEQTPVTAGPTFTDVIRQTAPFTAKLAPVVQANVPVDQFADNMKDFIQKLDIKHGNGMSEAVIQLFPKELGQVDVRITMHNGQLTALFHADNANAKDALDNQMAQLRVALQAQGLSVDKLEVTSSQSAAQLTNGQHGQSTGQQAFSNQNKSKGDSLQEDSGFEADVAQQQAIQDLGYGRAVNVTA
ncbi:flagellar hook-length control protein FliK [Paenibacillus sp. YAF4_2]|uniref:flagellar hook-length control protein FliK n=1 Tax=Paenibacillus sp. YAF4_2 TaxID=3233085 RepID=UPI003F99842C